MQNGWTNILSAKIAKPAKPKAVKAHRVNFSRANKYGAIPTTTKDGIRHPSARQAKRWEQLLMLQSCGRIRNLRREVTYDLAVKGQKLCAYRADHVYEELVSGGKWEWVVEDVKGFRTEAYKLKARMMLVLRGIKIREV